MNYLLFLLVGVALIGGSLGDERVIQGTPAGGPPDSISVPWITWQVAIEITVGNGVSLCGGSIISDKYVITAAHCVKSLPNNGAFQNPTNMRLYPGRTRSSSSATRQVARFWVEPSYDNSVAQPNRIDLAVLETIDPFDFGLDTASEQYASPIARCDSATQSCFPAGAPCFVSGYGQRESGVSSSTSQSLIYAPLEAASSTQCADKFNSNFNCGNCLPATNICAGSRADPQSTPTQDSCFGDSGGPLFINIGGTWFLEGVVSSGTVPAGQSPACGKADEYGVYVSVSQNKAWIDRVLAGQEQGINNTCIEAGNCASFDPDNGFLQGLFGDEYWTNWWFWLAVVGGVAVIVLLIVACCCCCRQKY